MKSKFITIPEVFDILSKKKEHDPTEAENLGYCEAFLKMKGKDAKKVVSELVKEFKIPEKVAVKLVDIIPKSKEEATSILSGYSIMLSEKDLNSLVSYFTGE
jgi:DNA-directed RNA polymerase subunit F